MRKHFLPWLARLHEACRFDVLAELAYQGTLDWYDCQNCNEETPHDNGKCYYCGDGT